MPNHFLHVPTQHGEQFLTVPNSAPININQLMVLMRSYVAPRLTLRLMLINKVGLHLQHHFSK